MDEPIQRDGQWWWQDQDGAWLRWNPQSEAWEPHTGSPPQPAPPPKAAALAPSSENITTSSAPGVPVNRDLVSTSKAGPSGSEWLRDRRVLAGVVACVALAAIATTLTLSNDEAPSPTNRPTLGAGSKGQTRKAAFIKKVDRICSRALRKAARLPIPASPPQFAVVTKRYALLNDQVISRVNRMKWPKADRRVFRRLMKVG